MAVVFSEIKIYLSSHKCCLIFMHTKKTYHNLKLSLNFASSILNFKLFLRTICIINFGIEAEEMSHSNISQVR